MASALYSDFLFALLLQVQDIKTVLSILQVPIHWTLILGQKKKGRRKAFSTAALKSSTFFAQLSVPKICRILLAGTRAQEGGRED